MLVFAALTSDRLWALQRPDGTPSERVRAKRQRIECLAPPAFNLRWRAAGRPLERPRAAQRHEPGRNQIGLHDTMLLLLLLSLLFCCYCMRVVWTVASRL